MMDAQEKLPKGWHWVKLGEVCEINPSRPTIDRADDQPTTFVPMEAVDAQSGKITTSRLRPYGEVQKGYTHFAEGDVLFAKITPCMQNGKHAIAAGLVDGIGFGTTEFHVIRPGSNITPEWIHSFLRQPSLLQKATEHFTGAVGQQRIPPDYLKSLQIPLPPLPEQKRIAAILNEQMAAVERARKAADERIAAVKALPSAYLRNVFPGPDQPLPKGWRWVKLGEVCEISARQVDPTKEEYRDLPHVNGENIESGTGRLLEVRSAAEDCMTSGKYLFGKGVVLYSKLRPYLKKATIADFDGLCSADMYPLSAKPESLLPRFLLTLLLSESFTEYAVSESQRARMPKLNREQLFAYQIPLAPLGEQRRVAVLLRDQMATVERARKAAGGELATINALPAALLRRAFAGEL
jgi:restriction endonuclease S subunit